MVHLYSFMIGIVNIVKIIEIVIEPIPNYDKSNLRMEVLIIIAIMKIFHSSKDNSQYSKKYNNYFLFQNKNMSDKILDLMLQSLDKEGVLAKVKA